MPFCSQCGNQVPDSARFCRGCGAQLNQPQGSSPPPPSPNPPAATPPAPPVQSSTLDQPAAEGQSFLQRPVVKWGGIGCGGLLALFLLIGIISAIAGAGDSTSAPAESTDSASPTVATPTTAPTATSTPQPVADLHFCDHPASREFLEGQNKIVQRNIPRLESLGMDHFSLQNIPTAALDEAWARNVLADVRKVNADGKKLAETGGGVPTPAAEVNKKYREVGKLMTRFANLMSQTVDMARESPYPVSRWRPIANDAADAINDLHDEIEDLQDEILDECE